MRLKNIADTGEKRMLLRRIIIYSITFFLLGIIQCAALSRLKPLGATPDIVLGALCAVLMLDNKKAALVCAVGAGYFVDAIGGVSLAFTPLFYLLALCAVITLIEKMMPSFLSFSVAMLVLSLLEALYTWINMCIVYSSLVSVGAVWQALLLGALSTLVCSLPVYFLIKLAVIPIEVNRGYTKL